MDSSSRIAITSTVIASGARDRRRRTGAGLYFASLVAVPQR